MQWRISIGWLYPKCFYCISPWAQHSPCWAGTWFNAIVWPYHWEIYSTHLCGCLYFDFTSFRKRWIPEFFSLWIKKVKFFPWCTLSSPFHRRLDQGPIVAIPSDHITFYFLANKSVRFQGRHPGCLDECHACTYMSLRVILLMGLCANSMVFSHCLPSTTQLCLFSILPFP